MGYKEDIQEILSDKTQEAQERGKKDLQYREILKIKRKHHREQIIRAMRR